MVTAISRRERMRHALRIRNFSPRTEEVYIRAVALKRSFVVGKRPSISAHPPSGRWG